MAKKDLEKELEFEENETPESSNDIESDLPSENEDKKDMSSDSTDSEDADTEKELADSEDSDLKPVDQDINDESDDMLANIKPQDKANLNQEVSPSVPSNNSGNPKLDRFQDYINQYKKLQDQQRKGDLVNGLIAAGGKIGQSIAGKYSGDFVPDQTGNQMLAKMNERPLQQFEQGQIVQGRGMQLQSEIAANDPASPQSRLVRDYVEKRLGLKLNDDVSAADAQMLLKTIGKPTQESMRFVNLTNTNKNSPDYGKTILGKLSKSGAMFDSKGNPLSDNYVIQNAEQITKDANGNVFQVNKNMPGIAPRQILSSAYKPVTAMNPQETENFRPDINQRKALGEEQKRMDTMTKAAREGVESATKLEQALKSDNVYQGATLKTTLPKLMGFNGRMSPLEQQMWTGSQAWNDRAAQFMQTAEEGTLTEKNKQEALALLEDYKQNVNSDLQNISQGSQQHLEQVYSIPRSFSAKATQFPALLKTNKESNDLVKVISAKTGKSFMLPKDKVQEALKKKLIQPLAE